MDESIQQNNLLSTIFSNQKKRVHSFILSTSVFIIKTLHHLSTHEYNQEHKSDASINPSIHPFIHHPPLSTPHSINLLTTACMMQLTH